MQLHKTKNDLPESQRAQVIDQLQPLLSDSLDLYSHLKQAHWNIKGPNFISLHELFDNIAEEVTGHADLIGERIVQLGGQAVGTTAHTAKTSRLPEYPSDATRERAHVEQVTTSLARFGAGVRQGIRQAEEAGDADTADVLTEVSRAIDKRLWFVEAHLEEG